MVKRKEHSNCHQIKVFRRKPVSLERMREKEPSQGVVRYTKCGVMTLLYIVFNFVLLRGLNRILASHEFGEREKKKRVTKSLVVDHSFQPYWYLSMIKLLCTGFSHHNFKNPAAASTAEDPILVPMNCFSRKRKFLRRKLFLGECYTL